MELVKLVLRTEYRRVGTAVIRALRSLPIFYAEWYFESQNFKNTNWRTEWKQQIMGLLKESDCLASDLLLTAISTFLAITFQRVFYPVSSVEYKGKAIPTQG